jgi:hypothetical protein
VAGVVRPVAHEEEAVAFEDVHEVQTRRWHKGWPSQDAPGVTGEQQGRQRQAQLVDDTGGHELGEQAGTTFGEDVGVAPVAEGAESAPEVHLVLAGDNDLGDLGGSGAI